MLVLINPTSFRLQLTQTHKIFACSIACKDQWVQTARWIWWSTATSSSIETIIHLNIINILTISQNTCIPGTSHEKKKKTTFLLSIDNVSKSGPQWLVLKCNVSFNLVNGTIKVTEKLCKSCLFNLLFCSLPHKNNICIYIREYYESTNTFHQHYHKLEYKIQAGNSAVIGSLLDSHHVTQIKECLIQKRF